RPRGQGGAVHGHRAAAEAGDRVDPQDVAAGAGDQDLLADRELEIGPGVAVGPDDAVGPGAAGDVERTADGQRAVAAALDDRQAPLDGSGRHGVVGQLQRLPERAADVQVVVALAEQDVERLNGRDARGGDDVPAGIDGDLPEADAAREDQRLAEGRLRL